MMEVEVKSFVLVDLKEEAFTEDFMEDFRKYFFPFFNIHEHAEYIARLAVSGDIYEINTGDKADQFVEGYGPIGEFVTRLMIDDVEAEVTR